MLRLVFGTASIAAFLLFAALAYVPMAVNGGPLQNKRNVYGEETSGEVKICDNGIPCGWAMFATMNGRVDYFVENSCQCKPDMQCRKTETNKYVSAYVYRCT